MLQFLLADQNIVFAISLALLVAFFVIEVVSLLFGTTISGLLGDVDVPEIDLPGVDIDMPGIDIDVPDVDLPDLAGPDAGIDGLDVGVFARFLYWLKIGKVPLLILVVIFMTAFTVSGYVIQLLCLRIFSLMFPAWLASLGALFLSVPVVRVFGGFLTRVMPRDETAAISQVDLVGYRARIVIGTARRDHPAQAKASDKFGTTHYLMVEPDDPEESLETGRELLLVRHDAGKFYAVPYPGVVE